MTNFERWKDEMLGIIESNDGSPAVVNGRPMTCEAASCGDCEFGGKGTSCTALFVKWLYEEAKPDNKPEEPFEGVRSCENCIYDDRGEDEQPCVECCERYLLKFEPKPKEPKLKMCPFCGIRGGIVGDGEGNYRIQCYHCLATTGWHVDKEKAIEAWNTRKGE